ncbi:hypothetical protein [Actinoplanes sp. TFC3]|uniref:hypothetical protein n=1 Tax=Actinoplanes sp. TFC3 TaxID=1710355 RepID=UPI00083467B1|nr:hypothetical protein [Actinoplanes sp. TFC3]
MTVPLDPATVIAEFAERVAPYDPVTGVPPVALVGVRTATGEAVFQLSDHVLRAMCRALEAYRDPQDRGTCVQCGGRRLDDNLHCPDCGRLHGILGEVIARHARRVAEEAPHGPAA